MARLKIRNSITISNKTKSEQPNCNYSFLNRKYSLKHESSLQPFLDCNNRCWNTIIWNNKVLITKIFKIMKSKNRVCSDNHSRKYLFVFKYFTSNLGYLVGFTILYSYTIINFIRYLFMSHYLIAKLIHRKINWHVKYKIIHFCYQNIFFYFLRSANKKIWKLYIKY